jgi:hypothetical protein
MGLLKRIDDAVKAHCDGIDAAMRNMSRPCLRDPGTKRLYYEGDIAPESLINRPPGSPPIGAMVSVDPATGRINKIFIP